MRHALADFTAGRELHPALKIFDIIMIIPYVESNCNPVFHRNFTSICNYFETFSCNVVTIVLYCIYEASPEASVGSVVSSGSVLSVGTAAAAVGLRKP